MKAEDFDHIGKRLYEHEADPPKNGWDKIAGAINTPKTPGRISWLKKKLWIPLAVVLPIASWLILSENITPNTPVPAWPPKPERRQELAEPPVPACPPKPERRRELAEGPAPHHSTSPKHIIPQDPSAGLNNNEEVMIQHTNTSLAEQQPSQAIDTTLFVAAKEQATEEEKDEEQTRLQGWRLSLSFTPQYLTRSVRPIDNDEVFVTNIQGDEGKFSDRIGVGFAIGAGKPVAKNVYLDAHLTFSQSKQNTLFSFSTGNVDTLIAVQQPDQSVRVVPVYEETDRETTSRYSYGGIRITATYYFLSTPRGRLNLLAGAGVNYLLSADVKEKIAGKWIALDNTDLSKINYTLTVGAGYTLDLSKQWALMINPALTYHLRQVKNGQLPYRLNQRPFGLNLMLSRSL